MTKYLIKRHEDAYKRIIISIYRDVRADLLNELDVWRREITSKNCESHEEVEIMNRELENWIKERIEEDN